MITNKQTGQTIRFLQTSDDTGGAYLEMESSFAPHSQEPIAHYHPKQEEDFVVLQGMISVRINCTVKRVHKGETLHIPANTAHSMWNDSNETAIVNWKVTPALTTEYLLETGMGLAKDGRLSKKGTPPLLQGLLLAEKYSDVYRVARPPYRIQSALVRLLKALAIMKGYKAVYPEYLD